MPLATCILNTDSLRHLLLELGDNDVLIQVLMNFNQLENPRPYCSIQLCSTICCQIAKAIGSSSILWVMVIVNCPPDWRPKD